MTAPVLYRWPAAAHFGRAVPKSKFYEHGKVTIAVREKFVAEVQRITWAFKLADSTIHLRGGKDVPEVQVFVIDAKVDDVSDGVLNAIDEAVRFPTIFEINADPDGHAVTRTTATPKHADGSRTRLRHYYSGQWTPADSGRAPLPPALDLPGLYAALLTPLLPIRVEPGEPLSKAAARAIEAQGVEREIAALGKKIKSEPQLNRKLELRRRLRGLSVQLDRLKDSTPPGADTEIEQEEP